MEQIYKTNFHLSAFEVDCNGKLKLSTLMYFAQEAAGQHCLQLKADAETLGDKNLFWAVTRHKVVIHRLPRQGETVTLQTWPMPTTRVAYPRSFAGYDEKGELLFQGISIWVLMDITTRKMVLPGKSGIDVEGTLLGSELEMPRSIMPKEQSHRSVRTVTYSCLDRNGHMNNTRYLDWADDLLTSGFHADHTAKGFTVCYFNEGREGQEINLDWSLTEDKCLHVDAKRTDAGTAENWTPVFSAQIQF